MKITEIFDIITLESNQDLVTTVFPTLKGKRIRFACGSTLNPEKTTFFINYPKDDRTFNREKFRQFKFKSKEVNGETMFYVDIRFKLTGSFRFYYAENEVNTLGSGFCLILPFLISHHEVISSKSLLIQKIDLNQISVDLFKKYLTTAIQFGYNTINLSPIQHCDERNLIIDHTNIDQAFKEVRRAMKEVKDDENIIFVNDLHLHQVSKDCDWIKESIDDTVNLQNTPSLRPAFIFDRVLFYLNNDIIKGKYNSIGLTKETINKMDILNKLRFMIKEKCLKEVKFYQFYFLDIDEILIEYEKNLKAVISGELKINELINDESEDDQVLQDPLYRRCKSKIVLNKQYKHFYDNYISRIEKEEGKENALKEKNKTTSKQKQLPKVNESEISLLKEKLKVELNEMNNKIMGTVVDQLTECIDNIIEYLKSTRVNKNKLELKPLSDENPLLPQYFQVLTKSENIKSDEQLMFDEVKCKYIVASFGYPLNEYIKVTNDESSFNRYLRRELRINRNSLALRYDEVNFNSLLFTKMRKYIENVVEMFDGFVLIAAKSIPIHVLEHYVDHARSLKSDLYILGELSSYTNTEDNVYVNLLGLCSVIHRPLNERKFYGLKGLIKKFGPNALDNLKCKLEKDQTALLTSPIALFIDSYKSINDLIYYQEKNDLIEHLISISALTIMSRTIFSSHCCNDELLTQICNANNSERSDSNVDEENIFTRSSRKGSRNRSLNFSSLRRYLNQLHQRLSNGYTEIYVDYVDNEIIAVTRHNPLTYNSVVLITRTNYFNLVNIQCNADNKSISSNDKQVSELEVPGRINKILLEARANKKQNNLSLEITYNIELQNADMIESEKVNGQNLIKFNRLTFGSIIIFDVSVHGYSNKRKFSDTSFTSIV